MQSLEIEEPDRGAICTLKRSSAPLLRDNCSSSAFEWKAVSRHSADAGSLVKREPEAHPLRSSMNSVQDGHLPAWCAKGKHIYEIARSWILWPVWELVIAVFLVLPQVCIFGKYMVVGHSLILLGSEELTYYYVLVSFYGHIGYIILRMLFRDSLLFNAALVVTLLINWLLLHCRQGRATRCAVSLSKVGWNDLVMVCYGFMVVMYSLRFYFLTRELARMSRQLASQKKRRLVNDRLGIDLDLTYITHHIIAMGWPTENFLEQQYRNPMDQVQRFLNSMHAGHYKVYNLCSERTYQQEKAFEREFHECRFPDHNPSTLKQLSELCTDMSTFLKSNHLNVVAVHCKAGKGRTGMVISALLLHTGKANRAPDALAMFGRSRTHNGKGVTIPSQIRYVHYYEVLLHEGRLRQPRFLRLRRVEVLPELSEEEQSAIQEWRIQIVTPSKGRIFDSHAHRSPPVLEGDVKFIVFRGEEKLFQVWMHTAYSPPLPKVNFVPVELPPLRPGFRGHTTVVSGASPLLKAQAPKEDLGKCAEGHSLHVMKEGVWICDYCGFRSWEKKYRERRHCAICDYNICKECVLDPRRTDADDDSSSAIWFEGLATPSHSVTSSRKTLTGMSVRSLMSIGRSTASSGQVLNPAQAVALGAAWGEEALTASFHVKDLDGLHKGDKDKDKETIQKKVGGMQELRFIFTEVTSEEEKARANENCGSGEGEVSHDYDHLENDTDTEELLSVICRGYLHRRVYQCSKPRPRLCELSKNGQLHIGGSGWWVFDTLNVNIAKDGPNGPRLRRVEDMKEGRACSQWLVENPRMHNLELLQAADGKEAHKWEEAFADVLEFHSQLYPGVVFRCFLSRFRDSLEDLHHAENFSPELWRIRLFVLHETGSLVVYSHTDSAQAVCCDVASPGFSLERLDNLQVRGLPQAVLFKVPAALGGWVDTLGDQGASATEACSHHVMAADPQDFEDLQEAITRLRERLEP